MRSEAFDKLIAAEIRLKLFDCLQEFRSDMRLEEVIDILFEKCGIVLGSIRCEARESTRERSSVEN